MKKHFAHCATDISDGNQPLRYSMNLYNKTFRDNGYRGKKLLQHSLVEYLSAICGGLEQAQKDALFEDAVVIDNSYINANPYLQKIKLNDISVGNVAVSDDTYERYDIVALSSGYRDKHIHFGSWGIMSEQIQYPALRIRGSVWMSISPSEIETMELPAENAKRKVLTLGLGMGYYAYMVHIKKEVESVTVAESDKNVIDIFKEYILPQFDHPEKITIIHSDAYQYLDSLSGNEYDYCFADLWISPMDGVFHYAKLIPYELKFSMLFFYWIENAILGTLSKMVVGDIIFESSNRTEDIKTYCQLNAVFRLTHILMKDEVLSAPEDLGRVLDGNYIREKLYRLVSEHPEVIQKPCNVIPIIRL